VRLTPPLRRRNFALLFAGSTASLVGDGIYLVAIAFQVLALENQASTLSLVLLSWSIGLVGSLPLAGVVVDRFDRRAVMVTADGAQLAATAALGVLSVTGAVELWHCAAAAFAVGAGAAFLKPAGTAILPGVVPAQELVPATALQESAERGATLFVGPALGGLLASGVGPGVAFLVDAATFAVSMACVALLRVPARAVRGVRSSFIREAREGVAYVRGQPWIWGTLVAVSFAVLALVGPLQVVLPYVVKNDWGGNASDYGLLLAASGAAGLLVSLVVGERGLPRRPITAIFLAWGLGDAAMVGFGVVGSTAAAVPFAVALGLGYAGEVIWFSLLRIRVPDDLLGRVSSLDWLVSFGLLPVSFAICGPLSKAIGAQATLIGAGVLGSVPFLIVYLVVPAVRQGERSHR
jgi:DHA3 family tetracycline resistance protein-like MFS transporter